MLFTGQEQDLGLIIKLMERTILNQIQSPIQTIHLHVDHLDCNLKDYLVHKVME